MFNKKVNMPISLSSVYDEDVSIAKAYLKSLGHKYDRDPVRTKLMSTIIHHNNGDLLPEEHMYIVHPKFLELYMMDIDDINYLLLKDDIVCPRLVIDGNMSDKIYAIKKIINNNYCLQYENMETSNRSAFIYNYGDDIKYENWKFGNIYDMSPDNNYADKIIVGRDLKPVKNPDFSETGDLSIPIEITKHLKNAYIFYKDVIETESLVTIQFKHDDDFIVDIFGDILSENDEIFVQFSYGLYDVIIVNDDIIV